MLRCLTAHWHPPFFKKLRGVGLGVELHGMNACDGAHPNKPKKIDPIMKTKLTLLSAIILAGIGSTIALAGHEDHAAAAAKPAAKSCCAMKETAPATPADKDADSGMSCHPNAAVAKEGTAAKSKGCCK
jgi:hypothetical protein